MFVDNRKFFEVSLKTQLKASKRATNLKNCRHVSVRMTDRTKATFSECFHLDNNKVRTILLDRKVVKVL